MGITGPIQTIRHLQIHIVATRLSSPLGWDCCDRAQSNLHIVQVLSITTAA